MGLDPESGEYEVGINNPTCHVTVFASETPKYVEVRVEGVSKCPGIPWDPPNGTFLLTQLGDATTWRLIGPVYGLAWELTATFSRFAISQAVSIWFFHQQAPLCQTFFTNQNVCGNPFIGKDGTAELFWGPAIHP